MEGTVLNDHRSQLSGIARHFGMTMDDLRTLINGPLIDLFERIVRLNVTPRFNRRLNTVLLYQSLHEHCLAQRSVDARSVPSPASPAPSNSGG